MVSLHVVVKRREFNLETHLVFVISNRFFISWIEKDRETLHGTATLRIEYIKTVQCL